MSRLSTTLSGLASENKKALIVYIVAGDPTPEVTVPLMHGLVEAGVDVIELGMPFSDPEAEGPVIQRAHERALTHGVSLRDCLTMASEFRKTDQDTPIVLMGYLNPIELMGYERFAEEAGAAGISGTIIVNQPPEEAGEADAAFADHGIDPVYLLAPTTTDERAKVVCRASRGFVYYVSLKGTTGASTLDIDDVAEKMARFRKISRLPIMVGFGVRDGQSARAVAEIADGAVVGSAIVKLMEEYRDEPDRLLRSVKQFVSELRTAID